jgi:transcription termination/antitermination protein NusG
MKTEERKILPGYLLVELQLPDTGWHSIVSKIVGINGVSGFLSGDPNGKVPPSPLSAAEHKRILVLTGELPEEKTFRPKQDFAVGEEVLITAGPFASFNGTIDEVDEQKGRLRLSVQIFGRSTPVEVDFNQVEKVVY